MPSNGSPVQDGMNQFYIKKKKEEESATLLNQGFFFLSLSLYVKDPHSFATNSKSNNK